MVLPQVGRRDIQAWQEQGQWQQTHTKRLLAPHYRATNISAESHISKQVSRFSQDRWLELQALGGHSKEFTPVVVRQGKFGSTPCYALRKRFEKWIHPQARFNGITYQIHANGSDYPIFLLRFGLTTHNCLLCCNHEILQRYLSRYCNIPDAHCGSQGLVANEGLSMLNPVRLLRPFLGIALTSTLRQSSNTASILDFKCLWACYQVLLGGTNGTEKASAM